MKKKVLSGLLSLAFLGCLLPQAADAAVQSIDAAPMFHGTTAIVINAGSTLDFSDAKYRLFAYDAKDGDLTNSIELVSGSVDTQTPGTYELHYRVTDSDHQTVETTVSVTVQDEGTEKIQRTLYTLPDYTHVTNAGMTRANNHDKQNLGFLLPANTAVKIRQISGGQKSELTLRTDDRNTQKTFSLTMGSAAADLSNTAASVPFVRSQYQSSTAPVIEIEFTSAVPSLVYYLRGDNEAAFFTKWDQTSAPYAVIESDQVTMLVPKVDRNVVTKSMGSIDAVLAHYDSVISLYDRMTGLSYDAEDPLDQNVRVKFFMQADLHGAGGAYYGGDCLAQSKSGSMDGFFKKGWMAYHELGHGYEGAFVNNGAYLQETWNNLYANEFQMTYDQPWFGDWNQTAINAESQRRSGKTFGNMNYPNRLYVLSNMLEAVGGAEGAMAYFNQGFRKLAAQGKGSTYKNYDLMAMLWGEYGDIDILPYIHAWGMKESEIVADMIYERHDKAAMSIRDLVGSNAEAEEIRQTLGKRSIYSLVTPDELAPFKVKGTVTVNISIDQIDKLRGKYILIKNGTQEAARAEVTGAQVTFENLPVGVYQMKMPMPDSPEYAVNTAYLTVSAGQSETNVSYTKTGVPLADTQIQFLGLGNSQYCTATFNGSCTQMKINTTSAAPHSYFSEVYSRIVVKNTEGAEVGRVEHIGNAGAASNINVPVGEGYTIEIFHKEPANRLVVYNTYLGAREMDYQTTETSTTYVIRKNALQKANETEAQFAARYVNKVKRYINHFTSAVSEEEYQNLELKREHKRRLYAIFSNIADQTLRESYLQQYGAVWSGGKPAASVKQDGAWYVGERPDPRAIISAPDPEDGEAGIFFDMSGLPLDSSGLLTESGEYMIAFRVIDSDGNTALLEPMQVRVLPGSAQLSLDRTEITQVIHGGLETELCQLTAVLKTESQANEINPLNLIWSSSDSSVAEVSETGVVTAKGITGTAIITASGYGTSAQCVVSVARRNEDLDTLVNDTFTMDNRLLTIGDTRGSGGVQTDGLEGWDFWRSKGETTPFTAAVTNGKLELTHTDSSDNTSNNHVSGYRTFDPVTGAFAVSWDFAQKSGGPSTVKGSSRMFQRVCGINENGDQTTIAEFRISRISSVSPFAGLANNAMEFGADSILAYADAAGAIQELNIMVTGNTNTQTYSVYVNGAPVDTMQNLSFKQPADNVSGFGFETDYRVNFTVDNLCVEGAPAPTPVPAERVNDTFTADDQVLAIGDAKGSGGVQSGELSGWDVYYTAQNGAAGDEPKAEIKDGALQITDLDSVQMGDGGGWRIQADRMFAELSDNFIVSFDYTLMDYAGAFNPWNTLSVSGLDADGSLKTVANLTFKYGKTVPASGGDTGTGLFVGDWLGYEMTTNTPKNVCYQVKLTGDWGDHTVDLYINGALARENIPMGSADVSAISQFSLTTAHTLTYALDNLVIQAAGVQE